jgi:hypothetical protein
MVRLRHRRPDLNRRTIVLLANVQGSSVATPESVLPGLALALGIGLLVGTKRD